MRCPGRGAFLIQSKTGEMKDNTMAQEISTLQKVRSEYQPKLPAALKSGNIKIELGEPSHPETDQEEIKALFPKTYGQPLVKIVEGDGGLTTEPLTVGVVLSGGQAPGGHNVIAGLFDALKAANKDSKLFGFLKGPGGAIDRMPMPLRRRSGWSRAGRWCGVALRTCCRLRLDTARWLPSMPSVTRPRRGSHRRERPWSRRGSMVLGRSML